MRGHSDEEEDENEFHLCLSVVVVDDAAVEAREEAVGVGQKEESSR